MPPSPRPFLLLSAALLAAPSLAQTPAAVPVQMASSASAPSAPWRVAADGDRAVVFRASAPEAGADTVPDRRRAARNRAMLRLPTQALESVVRAGPAGSISIPTGFGAEGGELFAGVGYQARTRYTDDDDGGFMAGIGVGTRRVVALEVSAASYSTLRGGGPGETGGISVKLHRGLPWDAGVAVGYENALLWGDSDADPALYGAVSKLFRRSAPPGAPLDAAVLTVGIGNGRFRTEDDIFEEREGVNVFGSLGVRIAQPLSVAADWTGQDITAGLSITPLSRYPLVITPGLADLTGSAGDGVRFVVSVGYGTGFRAIF